MRKIISIFGVILVLMSFASAHAGEDDYSHHGMMDGMYGYGFMWIFGWLFMILVIVALALLIVWLIKQITSNNKRKRR